MKHQKVMLAVFVLLVEASIQTLAQDQTVAGTNGWPYGPYNKNIVKAPVVIAPSLDAALTNLAARMTNGTYRVSLTNAVLLIANQRLPWAKDRPVERLALLFTKFDSGQATYKWLYFNPVSSDWVTGAATVEEVYDKFPEGPGGGSITYVPGNNTRIQAGTISLTWSRGDRNGAWIYLRPEHSSIQELPAEQFDKIPTMVIPIPVQQ